MLIPQVSVPPLSLCSNASSSLTLQPTTLTVAIPSPAVLSSPNPALFFPFPIAFSPIEILNNPLIIYLALYIFIDNLHQLECIFPGEQKSSLYLLMYSKCLELCLARSNAKWQNFLINEYMDRILSQYICVSNHHIIYFKYLTILLYLSRTAKKINLLLKIAFP